MLFCFVIFIGFLIRHIDIDKRFDQDNIELENDCEKLTNYYDCLVKQRAIYYDTLQELGPLLTPRKRKCTDLDLTVDNIQKIVNGTILTLEVGDI